MSVRLLVLLTIVAVAGCSDSGPSSPTGSSGGGGLPPAPSAGVPFTMVDLRLGAGDTAMPGQTVLVNYAGWLYDAGAAENKGQLFDQANGFQFTLGAGQVISGWDEGVAGMREGGIRRLVIPPEMAYGSRGAGDVIPPNATLVFDVELVAVN